MPKTMSERHSDKPRFYGRRSGKKLNKGRKALVEDVLPQLRLAPDCLEGLTELSGLFDGGPQQIWMEIGFGAGEHLAGQAERHPDISFIGCEPFINGVAAFLSHRAEKNLNNVRLFDDDARLLLDCMPDCSIDRLYLLFADPWPKKRHHFRRFVNPDNLDRLARILKPGGAFIYASDHMGYVRWTLDRVTRHEAFDWPAESRQDWQRPDDWIETRYEKKARAQGIIPAYLKFIRKE